MSYIKPGELDRFAELQSKTITSDSGGGDAIVWAKEKDLWCKIKDASGKLAIETMSRSELIRVTIIARYDSAITTEKRIVHDSKNYRIEAVMRRGSRKEFMEIVALEGGAT